MKVLNLGVQEFKPSIWYKFRIWLGLLVLPLDIKKLIATAISTTTIMFDSPSEFAEWLANHSNQETSNKEIH